MANAIRDLSTPDQGDDNAAADDEREHEAVDAVPLRRPAAGLGAHVGVVEEVEGEELRNERVFDGEEEGGPGYGRAEYADGVAWVALFAAVFSPFETPVDCSKEGEDLVRYQCVLFCKLESVL